MSRVATIAATVVLFGRGFEPLSAHHMARVGRASAEPARPPVSELRVNSSSSPIAARRPRARTGTGW